MSPSTPERRPRDAHDDPIEVNIDRAEHDLFVDDEDRNPSPTRPNRQGDVATGGEEDVNEADAPATHGSEGGSGATRNIWSGDDLPGGHDTDKSWN